MMRRETVVGLLVILSAFVLLTGLKWAEGEARARANEESNRLYVRIARKDFIRLASYSKKADGSERHEARFGLPSADYAELDGFTIASYGPASTAWVAYTIDPSKTTATEPRQAFHEASDVPHEFRPRLAWYEGWNAKHKHDPIQKGHLFPARAAAYSAASERACFEARNILPQSAALNVGPWKEIETHEFDLGKTNTVYICCGPLWAPVDGETSYTVEMVGGIPKPPGFWKSILIDDGKTIRAESWIFPNRNDDLPDPDEARVSIDELEGLARLNLWPDVPGEVELEAAK